jgi:hypothetical protein
MDRAKIRLSPKEAELVVDAEVILTKNSVLAKVKSLLEQLVPAQQELLQAYAKFIPPEVLSTSPKISRGENYKGLPYLVLDQPRRFEQHNHFAIRTMFWWGHYFSLTLQLSGQYKQQFEAPLARSVNVFLDQGFSICNSDDEWEHDIGPVNYLDLASLQPGDFHRLLATRPFIKLSRAIPLEKWEEADLLLLGGFEAILKGLRG